MFMFMKYSYFITIFTLLLYRTIDSAKLLQVYPLPLKSHQSVFQALTTELVKRRHEIVTVTPLPQYINNTAPENLKEIDASHLHEVLIEDLKNYNTKRGIVVTPLELISKQSNCFEQLAKHTFEDEQFKRLLNQRHVFDLIITESFFFSPLMLAKKYNAPFIWFSSYYGMAYNYAALGAPDHPLLYPDMQMNNLYNLNIWERIYELFLYFTLWKRIAVLNSLEMDNIKNNFKDTPNKMADLTQYVDLLFLNVNPMFQGNIPVPRNILYLGSLHMKPVQELPKELKSYLDSSTRGVVYVSLGTLVVPSMMDDELLDVFLDAIEALPYDVLWKYQNATFTRNVSNLQTADWFPQRSLLHHPNIKAFVTQCGLQSTDEAIDAEVPLVGVPVISDQGFNAARYERLGIGVKLDSLTFTAADLVQGVKTVIEDPSYRANIKRVKKQMQDQPQPALDRALWWTEYLLRHKGAKFLRAPSADMTLIDYYQADVLVVLVIALVISLFGVYLILSFSVGRCRKVFVSRKLKHT